MYGAIDTVLSIMEIFLFVVIIRELQIVEKEEEKKILDGYPRPWSKFMNKLMRHKGLKNYKVFQIYMPAEKMHEFADELQLSKDDCYITFCDYFRYRVKNTNIHNRQVIDLTLEEE